MSGEAPRVLCTLSLDNSSIRVFGSITQFLGKVGPELFIEVGEHDCTFRSLTDSSQSFGSCKFDREFFGKFEAPASIIRCKLAVKSFIAAFKNLKTVHSVDISFEQGAVESKLVFKLKCRMGIVKKYKFCMEECEILEAVFDTDTCLNKITCNPQKLSRIFAHMHGSVEVALQLTPDHMRVYTCQSTDADVAVDELAFLQSDLTIHSADFDHLDVEQETAFTICTRQLHAFLQVVSNPANKLNSVNIFANEGSAPILFSSELVSVEEVPVLSLKLILATYTPSGGSVPNSRGASSRPDVPITSELGRDIDAAFDQRRNDHRSGESARPQKSDRSRSQTGPKVEHEEVGNSQGEEDHDDDDLWLDTSVPAVKKGRF